MFGLAAIQPLPQETPPLAEVRLTGITTFGGKRALLSIHLRTATVTGVVTVGQCVGSVTVLAIDEAAGSVTVDNLGTVMVLKLGGNTREHFTVRRAGA